jgi:hypothetical protein
MVPCVRFHNYNTKTCVYVSQCVLHTHSPHMYVSLGLPSSYFVKSMNYVRSPSFILNTLPLTFKYIPRHPSQKHPPVRTYQQLSYQGFNYLKVKVTTIFPPTDNTCNLSCQLTQSGHGHSVGTKTCGDKVYFTRPPNIDPFIQLLIGKNFGVTRTPLLLVAFSSAPSFKT